MMGNYRQLDRVHSAAKYNTVTPEVFLNAWESTWSVYPTANSVSLPLGLERSALFSLPFHSSSSSVLASFLSFFDLDPFFLACAANAHVFHLTYIIRRKVPYHTLQAPSTTSHSLFSNEHVFTCNVVDGRYKEVGKKRRGTGLYEDFTELYMN